MKSYQMPLFWQNKTKQNEKKKKKTEKNKPQHHY